jgi:hypothetical protein
MTARLEEAIKRLPPDAVEKVADFAEELAERQQRGAGPLNLDWLGIAKEADDGEDTVSIQHRILREWPGG